jgi:hypothetical protein
MAMLPRRAALFCFRSYWCKARLTCELRPVALVRLQDRQPVELELRALLQRDRELLLRAQDRRRHREPIHHGHGRSRQGYL